MKLKENAVTHYSIKVLILRWLGRLQNACSVSSRSFFWVDMVPLFPSYDMILNFYAKVRQKMRFARSILFAYLSIKYRLGKESDWDLIHVGISILLIRKYASYLSFKYASSFVSYLQKKDFARSLAVTSWQCQTSFPHTSSVERCSSSWSKQFIVLKESV